MAEHEIKIIITGDGSGGKNAADKTKKSIDDLRQSTDAAGQVFGKLGAVFAGIGFAAIANDILKVNIQMESLRIQLESVTGSARKGATAFNDMLELARATPFEIADVTKAYLILKNSGLEPTHEVMDAITNQASKLGGRQEDLTAIATQLGQAYAKATLQMVDIKIIAEHGVPIFDMLGEVTGKTTAQIMDMSEKGLMMRDTIDKLIVKMGELSAGSNQRAMATLGGQISMLGDAWHKFEDALLNDKSEGILKRIVKGWALIFEGISDALNHATGTQLEIDETQKKIFSLQNSMNGAQWHSEEIKALQAKLPLLQKQLELEKARAVQEDAAAAQKAKDKKANEDEVNRRLLMADMRKSYGTPQQKMDLEIQDVKAKFKAYNMEVPQDILDGITAKYAKKLTAAVDGILKGAAKDLEPIFVATAKKYSLPPELLMAVAKIESNFRQKDAAGNPLKSSGGAYGVMQVIPHWHPKGEIDGSNLDVNKLKTDAGYNIDRGAQFLAQLMKRFGSDLDKVLQAYNASETKVKYSQDVRREFYKFRGVEGDSAQFETDIKLQKNQLSAMFSLAKNQIEVSLKSAQDMGSQTMDELNKLKESGKISLETYFAALGDTQKEVVEKQIAATQKKLALSIAQFNADAAQSAPEDLPKLKATFEIEQGSLQAELERLKAELAKVGIDVNAESQAALSARRTQNLQTRSSLLQGTQSGTDAQQALELDQLGTAFNAGQINAEEFNAQLDNIKNKYDETFQGMVQMGQGAAGALEKGFSDILFDPLHANFREIALAFLATLRRMLADAIAHAAIKAITNAISGAAGAASGGWAGIITGIVGAAAGAASGGGGGAGGYHTGGIVGNPKMHFNVSPLAFANAARYHSGGVAGLKSDEVPAVLQRGEEVLTRNDPRHRNNGGLNSDNSGGTNGGNVTSIVVMDPSFVPDAMSGQMGSKIVINHIRDNATSIKRMLDSA